MIASLSAILILLAGSALAVPVEHQKRASGVPIRQDSAGGQCLVLGGVPADGVILTTVPCAQVGKDFTKTGYGLFDISKGDQLSIRVTGTNFCLDAGSNPSAALGEGKIWTCYPGAPQQRWFYTDDNHIAITGGDTCLSTGRYGVFTIGCGSDSGAVGSQGWLTGFPSGPTTTAVTTTASATSTTPVTSTPVSPPPPPPVGGAGAPIYWNGDKTKCLTVNGAASDGQALVINNCLGNTAAGRASQYWTIAKGAGAVKLANTNYCLDFGLSPANGAIGKIWTCYDGAPQQNAYYTDDNHIALTGGSVCLDVRAESSPPKTVQQWQCSGSNGNQIFTL